MQGKVLQLSQRQISKLVAFCVGYEFEDIVARVTDTHRIEVTDFEAIEFSRRAYKLARMLSRSPGLARRLSPYPRNSILLEQDTELFFPIFSHTYELYALATLPNWRQRSKHAACFITEVWSDMLPDYLLELLAGFDHIFLGCHHSVQEVGRRTGRPCTYLPLGVDVPSFAPGSPDDERPIKLSYIGRRSDVTHRALLSCADEQGWFYYYDTVAATGGNQKNRTFQVDNPVEHRHLLATVLKRSEFFVANRSFVNRPEFTAGRDEISPRFYEGAAAGAVMLGEPPRSEEFTRQFDWPDAVIHLPFDSPDVGRIIRDLSADPDRMRRARYNNVHQAARRHDWLYRIQVVFDTLGLPYTDKMKARGEELSRIAAAFEPR